MNNIKAAQPSTAVRGLQRAPRHCFAVQGERRGAGDKLLVLGDLDQGLVIVKASAFLERYDNYSAAIQFLMDGTQGKEETT